MTEKSLYDQISNYFEKALKTSFQKDISPVITQSTDVKFGHYQCNNALKLAKELGKNPREIATIVKDSIIDSEGLIEKTEVAGPGFINIHLNPKAIASRLIKLLDDPFLCIKRPTEKKRVLVDFSSPNIAKQMHVGHLRSTIIGDSIARLYEFLGHDVVRINHVGDFGTQFGMLIAYLKVFYPEVVNSADTATLDDLVKWYKEAKNKFDTSPHFKDESRKEVIKLQNKDPESTHTWQNLCEISRKGFEEIYSLLNVKIEERGESFYEPYLQGVIDDALEKSIAKKDNGAICIFLDNYDIPIIIRKRDGGFNYSTTDLAAFKYRAREEKADHIIIVTDAGQSQHFKMVHEAAIKLGYIDPEKVKFTHVPFGVVLSPDGTKFKTRSGETEGLKDLLDEAILKSKVILEKRSVPNLEKSSKQLGLGAVKYADLSSSRIKDYTFSYDRMLRMEGNTAPFIQYAYVRINSIKNKIGKDITALPKTITLTHESEMALALHILQFSEALSSMEHDLMPHRITEYLFHLAESFHTFFQECHVEGTEEEDSRLLLCEACQRTIKTGLSLLGIFALEVM